jgi:hypothetical protein
MIQKLRGFFSNRKKAAATGAVVFGLLGTSVGGGITILAPASEDPPLVADYYMATSGSDSNLGTQGSPFLTMDKCADQAQSSAKTCEMASGTYSAQTLNISAGTRSGLMTFRPAVAGSVTINGISNGTNGGSNDKAQSFIKIDGDVGTLTINGSFTCWWNNGAVANDIYLNEITVTDTSSAGDLVSCGDTNNFSLTNSTLGPACCRGVGMGMGKADFGSPGNTNHIVTGNLIYGIWDTCNGVNGADAWPAEYAACSGTGEGDNPGCCRHIDGIQYVDAAGLTITNNRIYRLLGSVSQGIFVHANADGAFTNVLIANNMVAGTRQGGIIVDGLGGTLSGFLKVLHNSLSGSGSHFALGYQTVVPGTSVIIAGNISGDLYAYADAGGTPGCVITASDSSTITPTWNNSNGARACHSDTQQSGTFVSTSHPYDLSLQSGSNGVDDADAASICGSGFDVDDDIFGTLRFLGVRCDDGAHEKE